MYIVIKSYQSIESNKARKKSLFIITYFIQQICSGKVSSSLQLNQEFNKFSFYKHFQNEYSLDRKKRGICLAVIVLNVNCILIYCWVFCRSMHCTVDIFFFLFFSLFFQCKYEVACFQKKSDKKLKKKNGKRIYLITVSWRMNWVWKICWLTSFTSEWLTMQIFQYVISSFRHKIVFRYYKVSFHAQFHSSNLLVYAMVLYRIISYRHQSISWFNHYVRSWCTNFRTHHSKHISSVCRCWYFNDWFMHSNGK